MTVESLAPCDVASQGHGGTREDGASRLPRFNWPLAPDEVRDLGYSEFVCCPALAEELLDGGMSKVNGQPGFLMVVQRYENAVHFKWVPRRRRIMAPYR